MEYSFYLSISSYNKNFPAHPSAGKFLSPPVGGADQQFQLRVRHHPLNGRSLSIYSSKWQEMGSDRATSSSKEVYDRKQDDGSKQSDQHGRNGDRFIDRPDVKDGAEKVTSQESANNSHDNIDQQVRAVMHDFSRHVTNYSCNDKVYKKVHFYLQYECFFIPSFSREKEG
jgi:hypothetical protein